jgi:predicted DNA-binding transcriptional regulator AlpA
VSTQDRQILTAHEVAAELRCSKAQVYRLMKGEVLGIKPLPTISLGRKKVVQRSSFEAWKEANEENRVIVAGDSEMNAVDALH